MGSPTFDERLARWIDDEGQPIRLATAIAGLSVDEQADAMDRHLEGIQVLLTRVLDNDGDPEELTDAIALLCTEMTDLTFPLLMDAEMVAKTAGLGGANSVHVYRRRDQGVPEPLCKFGPMSLWDRVTVANWARTRRTRRLTSAA